MPRRLSNLGRLTRRAIKERQRRSNRTDQERLEDNERYRIKTFLKRAQELPEQREKRLEILRVDKRRRRAAQSYQQRREKINQLLRRVQMEHQNNQAQDPIAFSYEPDIQYCTSCKSVQIGNVDEVCLQCKEIKLNEETPEMPERNEK